MEAALQAIIHFHRFITYLFNQNNMSIMCRLLPLLIFLRLALLAQGKIISNTNTLKGRQARYHFDDSVKPGCKTVIMMGVGMAMTVNDYDKLSKEIVQSSSIVFIMTDINPYLPLKNCHEKDFADFTLIVKENLPQWIPVCNGAKPRFFLGGHSASGQSAMGALRYFDNNKQQFRPDGFIGLDPVYFEGRIPVLNIPIRNCTFDFSHGYQNLPTLNIGFEHQTCRVDPAKSASFAYHNSNSQMRVLIQIRNPNFTHINHCSFTDNSCPNFIFAGLGFLSYFVCGLWDEKQSALVRRAVAMAIRYFVNGQANPNVYYNIARVNGLDFLVAV